MSTKKAVASKKEEPKADKAKKGKEKDEFHAAARSNGDSKKSAKAEAEEKKPSKKAEEAPAKAEKAEKSAEPKKAEKAEAKPAKAARGSTSAKVYQQANSYSVGEVIFHPVWKVEGTVVEVGTTTDGKQKIVVDFPDFGVKRLIAENQAKA